MIAGFSITSLLLILLAGVGAGFVGYAVAHRRWFHIRRYSSSVFRLYWQTLLTP